MGFCAAVTMQGQICQAEVEGFLRERDSSADDVTPLCFSCICVPPCRLDTTDKWRVCGFLSRPTNR